jgi:hypothetical protein
MGVSILGGKRFFLLYPPRHLHGTVEQPENLSARGPAHRVLAVAHCFIIK